MHISNLPIAILAEALAATRLPAFIVPSALRNDEDVPSATLTKGGKDRTVAVVVTSASVASGMSVVALKQAASAPE